MASWAAAQLDYNSAPPNLSTLTDTSLFSTWRPKAHVLPPFGQIGDPCMHYTDPSTGLFHVGYLFNGGSGATTDDLVTYTDLNADGNPFIEAGGINDPIAVFDGSVIPSGINGLPTLLYTSVSYLPIQWTIAYTRGSETQSLAVSSDGGKNFTKLEQGPVIPSPPFAVNVTGFRDPYVFQSAQLDTLLNSIEGAWYVVISGGVHGDGPSQFLYRQHDMDFQYWEDMGQWWHETANSTWGNGDFAGRWGFNFETGNVFTLDREGYNEDGQTFVTLGAEWSLDPVVPQVSDYREMLWAAGNLSLSETGEAIFTPSMAGKLDWGHSAYAAAGKVLPASSVASTKSAAPDRFISYVWLTGNFYGTQSFPAAQNWTGALLLPRELSLGTISNVVDNDLSRETGSWSVSANDTSSGLLQLSTLQQNIAREPLAALLAGNNSFTEPGQTISSPGSTTFAQSPDTKFFVVMANLSFPQSARETDLKAGFTILSSEYESTTIYYQFSNESIIVDRSNSSAAAESSAGIDVRNEAGKLRLFDVVEGGDEKIETLELMIVVDNSVVEIHANGRFALGTWIRSWYETSRDVSFFHDGVGNVSFSDVKVTEGLYNAWPDRT
ncbi:hypothetical protein Daus18300_008469 [Diaporthe australafricana]|uniref:Extracellular invertase n=1 Tax=Diaporthe australafricana TaxID=127596 RepID=A0ABR3WIG2_9PEZI